MADHDILTPHLKCDVELEIAGPSVPTLNKWAADALRKLADRIEHDELEDGFHAVADTAGKTIGKVYVDYSEGDFEA